MFARQAAAVTEPTCPGAPPGGRLGELFAGAPVVIEACWLDRPIPDPLPEEAAQVARAVSRRRREFAAGRHLFRRALGRLLDADASAIALLNGADRAPCWPAGVVGSITHTATGTPADGYCAVVLGRDSALLAVGVDAEEAEPLEAGLWSFVLTPAERAALDREAPERQGLLAKLMFSAKECFYKAQYPLTRRFLGFQQVQITLDQPMIGRFQARLLDDTQQGGAEMSVCLGRYIMDAGLLLTGIAVPREGAQC
jgi:4'-phosphopantetheinyl transferase EntD